MFDRKASIALFPGQRAIQRAIPALHPDSFQVDERTLPQQLARMVHVAQSFQYYNLNDEPEGYWAEFLLADPVFLSAVIREQDLSTAWPRAQALFDAAMRAKTEQANDYWQHFFELAWQQVMQLNHWYAQTQKLIHPSPLGEYLTQLIEEKAGPAWQSLYDDYTLLAQAWPSFDNSLKSQINLPALWGFSDMDREGDTQPLVADAWWNNLLLKHKAILQINQAVVDRAGNFFEEALQRSDMSAQTGLILAFLGLLEQPKALLNQATRKHLDYYYRQVLGFRPEPATANRNWLTFTLPAEAEAQVLPKGTTFDLGSPDAEDHPRQVVTLTDNTLTATRFIRTDHWQLPEEGKPTLRLSTVSPAASPVATGLGWAFAAPQLQLSSGRRRITLHVDLKTDATFLSEVDSMTFWEEVKTYALDYFLSSFTEADWDQSAERVPRAEVTRLVESFWDENRQRYRSEVFDDLDDVFPLVFAPGQHLSPDEACDTLAYAAREEVHGNSNAFHAQALSIVLEHLRVEAIKELFIQLPSHQQKELLNTLWSQKPLDRVGLQQALAAGVSPQVLHQWLVGCFIIHGTAPEAWQLLSLDDSTEQEDFYQADSGTLHLCFSLSLSAQAPPLCAYQVDIHGGIFTTEWPLLTLQLKPEASGIYSFLKPFRLTRLRMDQEVMNLSEVMLSNSDGEIDPSQAFPPFGADPLVENCFYVDAPELWAKPIQALTLNWHWRQLPDDFANYYAEYNRHLPLKQGQPAYHTASFVANVGWQTGTGYAAGVQPGAVVLFSDDGRSIQAEPAWSLRRNDDDEEYVPELPEKPDPFFRLQLPQDFGQTQVEAVTKAVADANQAASLKGSQETLLDQTAKLVLKVWEGTHPPLDDLEDSPPVASPAWEMLDPFPAFPELPTPEPIVLESQPNMPYVPMAEGISVGYRSTTTWELGKNLSDLDGYSLGPWVAYPWQAQTDAWLPTFDHPEYLYLGIQPFTPGNRVSVLAQVYHTLSLWDAQSEVLPICAEYYSQAGNWSRLTIMEDHTLGFLTSGIWAFETPQDLSAGCPMFPKTEDEEKIPVGYLRIKLPTHLPELMVEYLHTQVVAVADTQAGLEPIPAHTPATPVEELADVETIEMPLPGEAGRAELTTEQFWQRAANRLHHKQRAGRLQDLETLALDAFPALYMARAIPETAAGCPGVRLLVAAKTEDGSREPWTPRVPGITLKALYEYLFPLLPPGVSLVVSHPTWEYLDVQGYVEWEHGTQAEAAMGQLRHALRCYLAPYYSPETTEDTALTTHGVYAFLKAQPNVINVHGLQFLRHDANTHNPQVLEGELSPSDGHSFLIPQQLLETETHA